MGLQNTEKILWKKIQSGFGLLTYLRQIISRQDYICKIRSLRSDFILQFGFNCIKDSSNELARSIVYFYVVLIILFFSLRDACYRSGFQRLENFSYSTPKCNEKISNSVTSKRGKEKSELSKMLCVCTVWPYFTLEDYNFCQEGLVIWK